MLERENRRKDLDARDKDALIRALTSRLERARADASVDAELRERAPESSSASASSGDPSAGAPGSPPSGGSPPYGEALRAARRENAELAGANAALAVGSRSSTARRRRRGASARGSPARARTGGGEGSELADLVASALEQERSAFEAQSPGASRVGGEGPGAGVARAGDGGGARGGRGVVGDARGDAARARRVRGAARVDAGGAGQVPLGVERERAALAERAAAGDRERETLRADLDAATAKMRESAEAFGMCAPRDVAFLRAEAETAQLAAGGGEEAEGLKRALKNVAELRRSEREALASRVAHAERERVAAQRAGARTAWSSSPPKSNARTKTSPRRWKPRAGTRPCEGSRSGTNPRARRRDPSSPWRVRIPPRRVRNPPPPTSPAPPPRSRRGRRSRTSRTSPTRSPGTKGPIRFRTVSRSRST